MENIEFDVNIQNEQIIIASLIKSLPMRKRILTTILPNDFIANIHLNLFNVIVKMNQDDLEFNIDTIIQVAGDIDIGNRKYLKEVLSHFDANANIDYHIDKLKSDKLKYRIYKGKATQLFETLISKNSTSKDISRIVSEMQDIINKDVKGDDIVSGKDISELYLTDFNKRMNNNFVGTGFKEIDDYLMDGFAPGNISVISGRPAMGKTIAMLNIISNLMHSKKMLICEIEMGTLTLVDMLASLFTGIDLDKLIKSPESLSDDERKRIESKVRKILKNKNLNFIDDPELSLDRIETELKYHKYDICFIDLFSRLSDVSPTPEGYTKKLYQAKRIARKTGTHLSLVHQIRRRGDKESKRPTLDRLKDSGAWEEVGDLIFGFHREKMYHSQIKRDVIEFLILKQKRGESNVSIPFEFNGSNCEIGNFVTDYIQGRDIKEF